MFWMMFERTPTIRAAVGMVDLNSSLCEIKRVQVFADVKLRSLEVRTISMKS